MLKKELEKLVKTHEKEIKRLKRQLTAKVEPSEEETSQLNVKENVIMSLRKYNQELIKSNQDLTNSLEVSRKSIEGKVSIKKDLFNDQLEVYLELGWLGRATMSAASTRDFLKLK